MDIIKTCTRYHRLFKPRINLRKYSSEASVEVGAWPRRIVSGIQPTGALHVGNYFGTVRRCTELQEAGEDVTLFIADLHALTAVRAPNHLAPNKHALQMTAWLLAAGVDPERSTVFVQSAVGRCAELCWVLACLATQARLQRLPQYREKCSTAIHTNETVGVGLLLYPVLQAADVLSLRGTHVPAGLDQLQHLQLARDLARAFVKRHPGPAPFPQPHPLLAEDGSERVMSLRQPEHKMSKSAADPRSRILLTDTDDDIHLKIRKAVTDFTSTVTWDPESRPGVSNLVRLYCLATRATPEEAVAEADALDTVQFKRLVATRLCDELRPVRKRYHELMQRPTVIHSVLRDGAARARRVADETWSAVSERAGLAGAVLPSAPAPLRRVTIT